MPLKDKEKLREYKKEYRKRKKTQIYNQQHDWYERNKPRILDDRHKYYLENFKPRYKEIKDHRNQLRRQYRKKPEVHSKEISWKREYRKKPEVKKQIMEYSRKYHLEHYAEIMEKTVKLKGDVINHYSNGLNKCARCGIEGIEFLNIDHIEGRGIQGHDKSTKGRKLYSLLKREKYPIGFQVLCWNCNVKKHLDEIMQKPSKSKKGEYARNYIKSTKLQVFSALSNGKLECACCKENSDINLLTVDHIEGRKQIGHDRSINGMKLYIWLRKNPHSKGFQLLCWNCNATKGLFGICLHQRKTYDSKSSFNSNALGNL